MIKKALTSLVIIGAFIQLAAQENPVRNWHEMMLDPNTSFFETQKAFYDYWQGKKPEKGTGYSVFKRWEHYWENRINQDGSFPASSQKEHAYQQFLLDNPVDSRMKSGQVAWQELGPRNRNGRLGYMGIGRVNAIAFHPTDPETIYLGAPAGGFWITHDGGTSWTTTTDGMVTMGVSAILVHPEDPNRILIGTGDRDGGNDWGVGTMISEDGGQTFAISNEGMGEITVGFFAHHETDPNIVLAAGNGGIFKTTDFGRTWMKVTNDADNYRDIKYKPGNMDIAYASSNVGFFKSTNGGTTWTRVTQGISASGRIVIGVSAAAPERVYLVIGGTFQGCFLSTDSGNSFAMQSNSPNILGGAYAGDDDRNQSWYDLIILADPNNADILHVGGINIWRSDDAGKTWTITGHWWGDRTNEVHADHHTIAYNYLNNRIYEGNDGGIYWTDNQGATWNDISIGLGIGQMYKLAVSHTNRYKTMAGFQDNGSATLTENGWSTTGGGDGFECAIDPFTDSYSYSSVYYGSITRWVNNADSRQVAGEGVNGITESGAWVTPYALSEWDGNTMIIGYKNIWISRNIKDNSGIRFRKISDNLGGSNSTNCSVVETSPVDSSLFYFVRGDGRVFRTENLLANNPVWIDLTSLKPAGGNPSDLECHPYQRNVIYMTLGSRVYKSEDLGVSWTDLTMNLPDLPVNDVVYDRSSDEGLYVATDAGVYYRHAGMDSWVLHGQALPASVEVTELEIFYDRINRSGCRLKASTYGRGMWEVELAEAGDSHLPPYFLNAYKDQSDIELVWNPPYFPNKVTGYTIYRNGVVITTTSGNSYLDRNVPDKISFTYTVTANYLDGTESDHSNPVYIQAPISLPYEQNFEEGTQGWKTISNFNNWTLGTAADHHITGNDGTFYAILSAYAGATDHVTDYVFTPQIDLSEYADQTVSLHFNHAFRVYRDYDKFSVVYRTSPDRDWVSIEDLEATATNRWTWAEKTVDLPEEALVDGVQLGFWYDDSNEHAWGAAFDDVQLFINTTGVELPLLQGTMAVYPNPARGSFMVDFENEKADRVNLSVYDVQGRLVFEQNYPGDGIRFIRMIQPGLAAGQYQLVCRFGDQKHTQTLIIK